MRGAASAVREPLAAHVRCTDPALAGVVASWLADVGSAPDLATALARRSALRGRACIVTPAGETRWVGVRARVVTGACPPSLHLLDHPDLPWCEVVEVCPARIQLRRPDGWGYGETIDVEGRAVARSPYDG